jgi:hypothetical protein
VAEQIDLPLAGDAVPPAVPATPAPLPDGFAWWQMPDGTRVQGRERCAVDGPKLLMCFRLESVAGWFSFDSRTRLFIERGVSRKHDGERDMLSLIHGRKHWVPFEFCPCCGVRVVTTFAEEVSRG